MNYIDLNLKVVGTRPIRPDGVDKVTGRAIYAADTRSAGMLWGKILRSPHAHAKILSIDTSRTAGTLPVQLASRFPGRSLTGASTAAGSCALGSRFRLSNATGER